MAAVDRAARRSARLAQQAIGELNCDVSWFITFAERVLDGATAYRDISDPNPPAAFLLYMPAVLVARALGVRVEAATVVAALVMALRCSRGVSCATLR